MRRPATGWMTALLLLLTAAVPSGRIAAQEPAVATPALAAEAAPLREILIRTVVEGLSDTPTVVRLLRITIPAGGGLPLHTLTGPELVQVEAGAATVRFEGEAVVAPASDPDTPQPALVPPIGEDLLLNPGDQFALPAEVPVAFRNDGPDPTTLLTVLFVPVEEDRPPELQWVEGTPSAETLGGASSRVLGDALAEGWPAGPLVLLLDRLVLAPGESLPGQGGPVLLAVEAGGFSFELLEGEFQVARAGSGIEAGTVADTPYALNPGDSVFFPESLGDVPRPSDRQVLVLLRLSVLPIAGTVPTGTPTASPTAAAAATSTGADGDATAAPTETATETTTTTFPAGATVRVSVTGVRLRTAASIDAGIAAAFVADQALVVTGPPEEGDGIVWYPVAAADDPAVVGYIAEEFLLPAAE